MFRHVFQSGQTLGNLSEKHRETSNVSEFPRKHFCFPGSKSCFRNNVSTGGQTWKILRKHRELQMFPQQYYLKLAQLVNLRLSETIRTSIIALNMAQLTPELRTFVIKTFYETSTLQQTRGAFGLINFA